MSNAATPAVATPDGRRHWSPTPGLAMGLMLLAFGLGVYKLGAAPVTWDEGFSLYVARLGLAGGAARTAQDVHPPVYYWSLGLWSALSGTTEFSLRFLSVAAAVALVALLIRWGRELEGPWAGITAGLVVALSPLVLVWAQSARMYTLGPLLATVVLYATWRLMRAGAGWWRWALGLVAGLAVLTHYVALVAWSAAAVVLGGWVIAGGRQRWRSRALSAAPLAVPALALAGWFAWALPQRTLRAEHYSLFPLDLFFRLYPTALAVGQTAYIERYTLPTVLAVAIAVLGVWRLALERGASRGALALCSTAVVLGIPALLLTSYPDQDCRACAKFHAEHILFMVPPFALLVGAGVAGARRAWLPLGMAALIVVAWPLASSVPGQYSGDRGESPYPPLTALLSERAAPEDGVLLYPDPEWPQYYYYALRAEAPTTWEAVPTAGPLTPQRVELIMGRLQAIYPVLWVVQSPSRDWADPEGLVEQWLRQHGTLEPVGSSAGWGLLRFEFGQVG